MKSLLKKILKNSFYLVFLLAFVWVSANLFFERETEDLMTSVYEKFSVSELHDLKEDIVVVNAFPPRSLDPSVMDFNARKAMVNIYEPLVSLDRDLNTRPALALSWGMIDDLNWEFILRKGVVFHDGSSFDSDDVAASFERALKEESEVGEFLTNVDSFEVDGDFTFTLTTKTPDPLLLSKISNVLIIPEELADQEVIEQPLGTAAYKLVSSDEASLLFKRHLNYWGERAEFASVRLKSFPDLVSRVSELRSGNADFLADVPYVAIPTLEREKFLLKSLPSLEVQFLLFNFDSDYFNSKRSRMAFSMAIDQSAFAEFVGEYAKPVNQFVSNGVFGYNPGIKTHRYDLEYAEFLADSSGLFGGTIHFHLPIGLDGLGEHVRTQLAKIGVNVVVSYMEMPDLLASIENRDADVYFFGFKADSADSSDFFNVVVRTDAEFNVSAFTDEKVDSMIEDSLVSTVEKSRLAILQDLMRIVVEDEFLGVPLFEYETFYAFSEDFSYDPRIDGFLYFNDIENRK